MQGRDSTRSSKDMLKTLEQAKLAHMGQIMASEDKSEAFIMQDDTSGKGKCCFPVHRLICPKQPLNRQEEECLIDTKCDG